MRLLTTKILPVPPDGTHGRNAALLLAVLIYMFVLAFLFGLRAVYSLRGPWLPKPFFVFLVAGGALVAWRLVEPNAETRLYFDIYTFVVLAEGLRVLASGRPGAGASKLATMTLRPKSATRS